MSRIEQSGRMSLRRPKPQIKGGSAPEEEEGREEEEEEEEEEADEEECWNEAVARKLKVLCRLPIINVLKRSGHLVYHQVCYLRSLTFCPQRLSTCFVYRIN